MKKEYAVNKKSKINNKDDNNDHNRERLLVRKFGKGTIMENFCLRWVSVSVRFCNNFNFEVAAKGFHFIRFRINNPFQVQFDDNHLPFPLENLPAYYNCCVVDGCNMSFTAASKGNVMRVRYLVSRGDLDKNAGGHILYELSKGGLASSYVSLNAHLPYCKEFGKSLEQFYNDKDNYSFDRNNPVNDLFLNFYICNLEEKRINVTSSIFFTFRTVFTGHKSYAKVEEQVEPLLPDLYEYT